MPDPCPNCGGPRSSTAADGLCPRCLMAGALPSDADITYSFQPQDPARVLDTLTKSVGPMPRVLLPDTNGTSDDSPVVKPSSTEMPAQADRTLRVQLLGEIARGGMGAVLKGRDADLGRDLAVKVLLETHRGNPDLIRRFVEEAQIGGQLQHPGIVPVYELGTFGDSRPYFTMKLVKGRTLADLLGSRKDKADEVSRFLGIFEQIAQTVAYAHARGVIHRDLKPSNVMVGSFGEVQVMDWGLAKVLPKGGVNDDASAGKIEVHETVIATARSGGDDTDLSRAGSVMGTPSYMAPEQARGEVDRIDERADVFALGSILCEILTGQPAFVGRTSGEIQRKAALGDLADALTRLKASEADPELIALTTDCLARETDDRPRNAGEVDERVDAYRAGVQERLRTAELDRARAEARAAEESKRRRLTLALAAAIIGLITLGGGGAAWLVQIRQSRLAAMEGALTRVEILRDQALTEGPGSTRRREALAAADQALATMNDLANSEPARRLNALRSDLARDEEQAQLDQTFIKDLMRERTSLPKKDDCTYDAQKIDQGFARVFQNYKLDLETTPTTEAVRRLKSHPAAFVQDVVSALDHWLIFRAELKNAGSESGKVASLRSLLDLASGLDPDPRRNSLRKLLEQPDLTTHRQELLSLAGENRIFEFGPATPLLLARSLILAKEIPTAIAVLKRSVIRHPGDIWTNSQLADLLNYSDPAQMDEAIRYYSAVRSLQPEAGWDLIPALLKQNRDREAEQLIDDLSRIDSENMKVLANLVIKAGRVVSEDNSRKVIEKRMIANLRASLVKNPNDSVVHRKIAILSSTFNFFDRETEISEYREASRLDPDNIDILSELGTVLSQYQDYPGAILAFRSAIRLAPEELSLHKSLAGLLGWTGDHAGEIAELREVIRCKSMNRPRKISDSQTRFASLFPNFDCLGEMIMAWFKQTEYEFDLNFNTNFSGVELFTRLGAAHAESGDIAGALAACEEGIRHCESSRELPSSEFYTLLGILRRIAGQEAAAIAAYRKAIEREPEKSIVARYGLVLALAESADFPGMIAEIQDAIRVEKDANARPFRLLQAISLGKDPVASIAALRVARTRAGDNQETCLAIDRAIELSQELSTSGACIPKMFRSPLGNHFPMLCYRRKFYTAAAAIWSQPTDQERYNASCVAALAGCGQGRDPIADETIRGRFRGRALGWLRTDLSAWLKQLETGKPDDRSTVGSTMKHWKQDTDLAGVRDAEALAKLPEAERKDWQALWAEVDSLLARAEGPKGKP